MGLKITSLDASTVAIAVFTALLGGCGGSSSPAGSVAATQSVALQVGVPADNPNSAALEALPTFHVAPVLLDIPDDTDAANPNASASIAPHSQAVPIALSYLSTRRLTLQTMKDAARGRMTTMQERENEVTTPMASGTLVATYSPAQIRAAYGLPSLPTGTPTASQAAQMGAGQTIYIVDSNSDPNVATELAAFNQKFGLPGCATISIPPTTKLPLVSAPTTGCTLSVVYNTSTGAMTSTAPAYDSGWQTEIALDVEWAHATAPMARIVLIEAPNAALNNLLGAVTLANTMGPGVVSMSFGTPEGSWTSSVDSAFTAANMTYLAATGDSGAAVEWPSVSPHVLGVGGTSLNYTAGSVRSETVWSGTGGGVSLYTLVPSYQTSSVPGMGSVSHRLVADVAFNADPATGQYVAIIAPNSTSVGWLSAGGTSLATPQWAGVIAVANAVRAQATMAMLGQPHTLLYGQIAGTPATYANAFADITTGSDGNCGTCIAKIGYDTPTGLGTPNAAGLLGSLTGSGGTANVAPVVAPGSVSGTTGSALSFTLSVTATHPVTFALSGAPAGMTVGSSGIVSWANPVAGTYAVTITVTDTKTGLTGKGTYTITIVQGGPVIKTAPMSGIAGKPVSGTITVTDATSNSVSVTISGVPIGMSFSGAGSVITATWTKPIIGTYTLQIKAQDGNGRTASGSVPITVTAH